MGDVEGGYASKVVDVKRMSKNPNPEDTEVVAI